MATWADVEAIAAEDVTIWHGTRNKNDMNINFRMSVQTQTSNFMFFSYGVPGPLDNFPGAGCSSRVVF